MKKTNRRKYEAGGTRKLGNFGGAGLRKLVGREKRKFPMMSAIAGKTFSGLTTGIQMILPLVGFAADPLDKELYIFCEFCRTRMLNCDIAEEIKRLGFAKERIRADCAEPKSNDDLRRLGISRIMPSVKGRDSILNGIAAISEYRITVHPDCVNMIRELSSYVYDDRVNENGKKMPKDSDNHLCDAMRYAFEDVKRFHPRREEKPIYRDTEIGGADLNGGWDI